MSVVYVRNFEEWQVAFKRLQTEADIIIHSGMLKGMNNWDSDKAWTFVLENMKIPVGTVAEPLMCCSVFGLGKNPSEQGRWAASAALEILDGKSPSMIPLARNKEGEILVNFDIAEKLDIACDRKILKNARVYQEKE